VTRGKNREPSPKGKNPLKVAGKDTMAYRKLGSLKEKSGDMGSEKGGGVSGGGVFRSKAETGGLME